MTDAQPWLQRASIFTFRVNVGWWLSCFIPIVFAVSIGAAILLLLLRRHSEVSSSLFWACYSLAIFVSAVVAFQKGRKHFFDLSDAIAYLDRSYRMGGRLMAASDGVARWPASAHSEVARLRLRSSRVFVPPAMSIVALVFAASVPVSKGSALVPQTLGEPAAWQHVETLLDEVEELELVEPEAIEGLRNQLEDLRSSPESDWFTHNMLEGSESLEDKTEDAIGRLMDGLGSLSGTLGELDEAGSPGDFTEEQRRDLGDALREMEMSDLPLRQDLQQDLRAHTEKGGRRLSRAEVEALRQRFEQGRDALGQALKQGADSKAGPHSNGGKENGSCPEGQQCQQQNRGGGRGLSSPNGKQGGIARGPGTEPLSFGDRTPYEGNENYESIQGDADPNSALGELLGLSVRPPESLVADAAEAGAAGSVEASATGGVEVWKDEVSPDERRVLERYFRE